MDIYLIYEYLFFKYMHFMWLHPDYFSIFILQLGHVVLKPFLIIILIESFYLLLEQVVLGCHI